MPFAPPGKNDQINFVIGGAPLNRAHDILGRIDQPDADGIPPAHDRAGRQRAQLSGGLRDIPMAGKGWPKSVQEGGPFRFPNHDEAVGTIAHQPGKKPVIRGGLRRPGRTDAGEGEERKHGDGFHAS